MLMLAHFDASGTLGDSPVFVMAGYIAPVSAWKAFTPEWQAALDAPRALDYFKMSEAWARTGQFQGFQIEDRDTRLKIFPPIINRHAVAAVIYAVSTEAWKRHFVGRTERGILDRPYRLAFYGVMTTICKYFHQQGIDDTIDVTFDDEGGEPTAEILAGYDQFCETAPEHLRRYLGRRPIFDDEKCALPLQAADMIAWHVRRQYHEFAKDNSIEWPTPTPISDDVLTGCERVANKWGEKEVKDAMDFFLLRRYLRSKVGTPMTIPSIRWLSKFSS